MRHSDKRFPYVAFVCLQRFLLCTSQAPIWVCTTNDGLGDVVQQLDPSQHQQLIFIQNGMLLPFLASHGLQHSTQVLLYMSGEDCAVGQ